MALPAAPASASLTIGQTGQGSASCVPGADLLQPTVTGGNSYVMPGPGTITSWTVNQTVNSGQQLTMKVFRKVDDPHTYRVIGHDGPATLTPDGTVGNTFAANVQVQRGDVLGFHTITSGVKCLLPAPGEQFLAGNPSDLGDGASGPFDVDTADQGRLDIQATLVPDNAFSLGKVSRNKKKGTATLNLNLPNPGDLSASGKGVRATSASRPAAGKSADAGTARLLIRAKGKRSATLNATGKVKLKPKITYMPTGGSPSSQSVTVKLIKRT